MGCLSSKLVTRSLSLREELNQSFQRTANGISSSGGDGDHFHAVVCPASLPPSQLLSDSFSSESNTSHKPDVFELIRYESTRKWELTTNADKEEEEQVEHAPSLLPETKESTGAADLARRSKSCHWSEDEHEMFSLVTVIYDENNKGITRARSRSFHTVEEYDALVEKLRSSRAMADAEQIRFSSKEESSLQLHHFKQSQSEDEAQVEEKGVLFSSGTETTVAGTREEPNVENAETSMFKGSKRKVIANGLESLEIPATIEFPRVGSLREWVHVGGQVYSPGAFVTPKFGSYALPISEPENKCIQGTIFDPELVAAFDECMEQLEEEEETILKQIEESFG
ncbi:hypothetical protein Patl1_09619 [Pistacia atlantica]|uniref:Uncharacterized protein n=1 Tax=Pistacia atlantica TaxID=434234 RepID=A0ACC1A4S6_9ROSI|nr:hypothetical protein Patl1_09619 [Pistacia atlantica]